MEQTPLIGPDAGELVPLLVAVAILSVIMFWPNIKPHLRGLWPTQRRTVRGRRQVRKTTAPRSSTAPTVDLPIRPTSLSRRRDLRPRPRKSETTSTRTKSASTAEVSTADPATTRKRVAALPAEVSWPLDDARLDRLPVIYDGEQWQVLDATASRHGVICGASRSGKGNLLQLLALEALRQGPERVQVWFLDPKGGLDYAAFLPLVHARVYADVAGESPFDGDLATGYEAALQEMHRRNLLMLKAGARTHHEYRMRTGEGLPYLILICDEVANLGAAQQKVLVTLAQMSAAAGIVVWAATQYPTADSLPSQMQANALDRIAFQFPSPRYTPVALGLAPGERPVYEPSAIDRRGVCILRQDGRDVGIGVTPLVDDARRTLELLHLQLCYPRATTGAIARPDGVALPAPDSAIEGAILPAITSPAPITADSGPAEALAGGVDSTVEKEDLVVAWAAEGKSQREIQKLLASKYGAGMNQNRLAELHKKGRAQATAQQPDLPAESSSVPDAPQAAGGDVSLSPTTLAAAA